MFGETEEIEDVVLQKRRFYYEEQLKKNASDYDTWFEYIRLEETTDNVDAIRELYERALQQQPVIFRKEYWKRYMYLWYGYAFFEEMHAEDAQRARDIYREVHKLTRKQKLFFGKLYRLYAEFEVRQDNLDGARKIYGTGLGECGKAKLYENYATLELRLGNVDRARSIYEKMIERHPDAPQSWKLFVEMELTLGEAER